MTIERRKAQKRAATKRWMQRHPERWRALHRVSQAKQRAKKRQNIPESCELCGVSFLTTVACRDHNHDTQKLRGWLCTTCNTGLGKLGDTVLGLRRAVAYLEKYE